MKITSTKTTHTTTIRGELTEDDIAAYLRSKLQLPDGVSVRSFIEEEEGGIRFEVVSTGELANPAATPEAPSRCTVGDCQFPSLAGGMCPSHLSAAHRARAYSPTLPSR